VGQHVSGKRSKLGFKPHEQGRRAFEGEAKDFVWCDEEPPIDIYTEILYRLLTTKGLAWTTFTPLLGMSEVVMSFLEPENDESRLSKYVVQAAAKTFPTWTKKKSASWSRTRRRTRSKHARKANPLWVRALSTPLTRRKSWRRISPFRNTGRGPTAST